MDQNTAQRLNNLNADFYQKVSVSFSATRQAPWQGWRILCDGVLRELPPNPSILDLACGNLRFEKYLVQEFGAIRAWTVDNCDALAYDANGNDDKTLASVTFQHVDLVQTMLNGGNLAAAIDAPPCDLGVCFGFMHHVALPDHRQQVLETLVEQTRPGGLVVTSFWQFERDRHIVAKAQALNNDGDYLLGWRNNTDARRYCHSFRTDEIDALVASVASRAHEIDRFWADGKSNDLNCYVVLRVR